MLETSSFPRRRRPSGPEVGTSRDVDVCAKPVASIPPSSGVAARLPADTRKERRPILFLRSVAMCEGPLMSDSLSGPQLSWGRRACERRVGLLQPSLEFPLHFGAPGSLDHQVLAVPFHSAPRAEAFKDRASSTEIPDGLKRAPSAVSCVRVEWDNRLPCEIVLTQET